MIQIVLTLIPIVTMMIFIPTVLSKYTEKQAKYLFLGIFVVYLLGNLYFTLLSREPASGQYLELVPFRSYVRLQLEPALIENSQMNFAEKFLEGTSPFVSNLLNILLFFPLGYLLPILFPKLNPKHVILIGCLCSIATEATQYILKMGWCETDDVIHNTLGTAIGVWVWLWQSKRLNAQRIANPGKGEV